jgi:hypothetical protein
VAAIVRVLRVAAAGLGIAAILSALDRGTGPLANFFSYFTIESNVLAVVVLLVGGVLDPRSTRWAYARGAVTLYMVITGIVYAVLLADVDVQLTTPWINDTLHRYLPLLLLLDWLLNPPWPAVSRRAALGWLAFPLAYFGYSLVRGPVVDWYPYPFLDPREDGYGAVAVSAVVLAAGMAVLALLVHRIGRLRRAPAGGTDRAVPQGAARG